MKDTALSEQLPGLNTPWSVKRVGLSMADQRITMEVRLKTGQVRADPTVHFHNCLPLELKAGLRINWQDAVHALAPRILMFPACIL
jgi:hypothetical protein